LKSSPVSVTAFEAAFYVPGLTPVGQKQSVIYERRF
jgi:hypothetical protein